jgi:hypothetical protein
LGSTSTRSRKTTEIWEAEDFSVCSPLDFGAAARSDHASEGVVAALSEQDSRSPPWMGGTLTVPRRGIRKGGSDPRTPETYFSVAFQSPELLTSDLPFVCPCVEPPSGDGDRLDACGSRNLKASAVADFLQFQRFGLPRGCKVHPQPPLPSLEHEQYKTLLSLAS